MGLRFRKSFKIAPGVKINLGKKSTSISLGGKGVHYTLNSKGKRTTSIGIPGTGVYYTSSSKKQTKKNASTEVRNANNEIKETKSMSSKKWYQKTGGIVLLLVLFFPIGLYLMWRHSNWNKLTKIIITAIFGIICLFSLGSDDSDMIAVDSTVEETTALIESTTQGNTELSEMNTIQAENTTDTESTTQQQTIDKEQSTTEKETTTQKEITTQKETTTQKVTVTEEEKTEMVWIPQSGKKYHSYSSCSGMKNPSEVSLETAERRGYTPCSRCY